jgi:hypothetical protein
MQFRPAAAFALVLCAAGAARAAEPDEALIAVNRELGVEATALHRSYKEVFGPGFVEHDRESGWAAGVQGRASWIGQLGPIANAFAGVQADWNRGGLNYRGTAFNSAQQLDFRTGLATSAVRGEIGKGFAVTRRLMVIPVLEGGWQWWRRDLGPGQLETYRSGFVGGGVRADYALTPRLTARARASVAELVSPAVRISYVNSYDLPLGERPRYAGGLGLDYAAGGRLHLTATAELVHYGFGASAPVLTAERGAIFEPTSRTSDLRLGGGLAWAF